VYFSNLIQINILIIWNWLWFL